MKPEISIIIPVYNAEKYLGKCIESVLNQTFSDFEIILIDDGSTDSSPYICDEYALKDKRINVIHLMNGGVSKARNKGLDAAKGNYITFADSDDVLEPDAFKVYYDIAKAEKADIVRGGYFIEDETSHSSEIIVGDNNVVFEVPADYYLWLEENRYYSFVWNSFSRHSLIKNLRFREDLTWLEDHTFFYKFYLQCKKMVSIATPTYHYFIRSVTTLSNITDANMIWKAADYELLGKLALSNTPGSKIEKEAFTRYGFLMEKFVNSIYTQNYSISERRYFAGLPLRINALPLRDSRVFFNKKIPFIIKDSILRAKYCFRKLCKK